MRTIDLDTTELDPAEIITQGEASPLRLQRKGVDVGVLLPTSLYESLLRPDPEGMRPIVASLTRRTIVERADVFRKLAKYERDHPEDN